MWTKEELESGKAGDLYVEIKADTTALEAKSVYNNNPGTGITGENRIARMFLNDQRQNQCMRTALLSRCCLH